VTTENTNLEHSDVEEASAGQQPVSETLANPDPIMNQESTEVIEPPKDDQEDSIHRASNIEDGNPAPQVGDPTGQTQEDGQAQALQTQQTPAINQEVTEGTGESKTFPFTEALPLVDDDVARPFTDFIEEFRQAEEARVISQSVTQWSAFSAELAESEPIVESFAVAEPNTHPANLAEAPIGETSNVAKGEPHQSNEQPEQAPTRPIESLSGEATASQEQAEEPSTINQETENKSAASTINREATRPVSPLLRPPSRIRLPRHGGAAGRQREETPSKDLNAPHGVPLKRATTINGKDTRNESPSQKVPTEGEAPQALPEPELPTINQGATDEQSRPARRYRFDRPSASTASNTATPAQPRSEEGIDTASHTHSTDVKASKHASPTKEGNGHQGLKGETKGSQGTQQQVSQKTPGATQSQPPEQERSTINNPVPPIVPETEGAPPATEPGTVSQTTEVALEDLPPLEYADLQRANSRRRRRRRPGDITPTPTPLIPPANTGLPSKPALSEPTIVPAQAPQTPAITPAHNLTPAPPGNQYNIVSGYTVSQMNQGNEISGPFMSPEPSPARGSTPARGGIAGQGRSVRAEVQRPLVYPVRTGDPSINQLANAVLQGIQAQTDRMVNELRRSNQSPSNISVSLPPFPSTERVGVFVDVANLLYSARTLRITIDFAKLLDFLRGNRRLVRAHAYCPTSPNNSEDQMFLQAVKGLGYRITTKNYKTFSSGAKKADLDLDLCMDVVRLVDGRAVDCIVLVSGDSDFMPMLDYCSDHGVRVEVAAFDEAMSATLRQSCDLFINLAMLEEIRA
jgi:uncharacterized LabA/DUF88 family protein